MKKIAIVFAAAAMMLAGACTSKEPEKTVPQEAEQAQPATEVVATQGDGKVVELTDAKQYAPGVKVSQLTILDFNAVWCGPCRQLAPVFDELAGKYAGRVTFVSVDVDKFGELFESYKLGQSILTDIQPNMSAQATFSLPANSRLLLMPLWPNEYCGDKTTGFSPAEYLYA